MTPPSLSATADAGSPFGPLGALVADASVTDVVANGPRGVWVDRGDGMERVPLVLTEAELRSLAVRLVGLGGRHLDEAAPIVDVRVGDGVRVHAVLAPLSTDGTCLSIRLPRARPPSIDELVGTGMLAADEAAVLRGLVGARANILITGAAGSGKTTLLAALLAEASHRERIVVIEDVAELRIDHPHVVFLQSRQPNLEGLGGVGLERLVREAMRMRPDRLVLGECRGAEIRDLLSALNTGHDGGAGTLHANSLEDVPARLEALGALAGLGVEATARQAVSAIGAVVQLERGRAGRRLAAIGRLELDRRSRLVART